MIGMWIVGLAVAIWIIALMGVLTHLVVEAIKEKRWDYIVIFSTILLVFIGTVISVIEFKLGVT